MRLTPIQGIVNHMLVKGVSDNLARLHTDKYEMGKSWLFSRQTINNISSSVCVCVCVFTHAYSCVYT